MRISNRNTIWLIGLFMLIGLMANLWMVGTVQAKPVLQSEQTSLDIFMFWGDGCPHCAAAKPYFEELAKKNPQIVLHFYEVWNDQSNRDYFIAFSQAHGFEPTGVPTIFIGDRYWVGFNDQIQLEIDAAVQKCLAETCTNAALIVDSPQPAFLPTPTPQPEPEFPRWKRDHRPIPGYH